MNQNGIIKGIGVSAGYAMGKTIFANSPNNNKNEPVIVVVPDLSRKVVISLPENVCAVVAECGSVGCHGAGLLRERNIPCVIRVENVFEQLPEGTIVEVVGGTGIVKILELQANNRINWNEGVGIEKGGVCYRPNRIYQQLRFDIMKEGWELSPEYLFDLPKCKLELKHGLIYAFNAPKIPELREMIVKNPDAYLLIAKKRELDIRRIKNELEDIQKNLDYTNLELVYQQLIKCLELYRDLLKYIYSTQFISDPLTEELIYIIGEYDSGSLYREKYINGRLKSDYVKKANQEGVDPGTSTTWRFPCGDPHIWQGEINWKRDIQNLELTAKIFGMTEEKGFAFFEKYCSLMLLVPILYQMAEEHYFVSSSINSFINKFIEIIADRLVIKGVMKNKEEIFEKPIQFIADYYKEGL